VPRIQLRLYTSPGEAQLFCRLRFEDGSYERLTATVDTGAAVSLFPWWLLEGAAYQLTQREEITIEQAGISSQSFAAVQAFVTIVLEDEQGNLTPPFLIPAWFADTNQPLIGFAGVLDRAVLHLDMPGKVGWLEIDLPDSQPTDAKIDW